MLRIGSHSASSYCTPSEKLTLNLCSKYKRNSFRKKSRIEPQKTAANSLARSFLKLNLLIPLINF